MKGNFCCFVIVLQIVSWVSATSRSFPTNDGHGVPQPGTNKSPQSLQVTLDSKEGFKSMEGVAKKNEEEYNKGINKLGSSPPSCENKCYGCIPCEAIQVPTTSSKSHSVNVQYANYEPEGWKCKCGPSFYSP